MAAWLGALLWWGVVALMLVQPVGTSAASVDGGATVIRAVYWRPGAGWAGVGFFALLVAAVVAPAAVVWLTALGRRFAVAGIGVGVLVLSFVAFLLAPVPSGLCWLIAGVWPRPGVGRRA